MIFNGSVMNESSRFAARRHYRYFAFKVHKGLQNGFHFTYCLPCVKELVLRSNAELPFPVIAEISGLQNCRQAQVFHCYLKIHHL